MVGQSRRVVPGSCRLLPSIGRPAGAKEGQIKRLSPVGGLLLIITAGLVFMEDANDCNRVDGGRSGTGEKLDGWRVSDGVRGWPSLGSNTKLAGRWHEEALDDLVYPQGALRAEESLDRLAARLAAVVSATPVPANGGQPVPTPETVVQAPEVPLVAWTDGLEALICSYPWDCATAVRIAACESGRGLDGRLDGAWATNGESYGLLQLWGGHIGRWPDMMALSADGVTPFWASPSWNVAHAFELWSEQGWAPWQCAGDA